MIYPDRKIAPNSDSPDCTDHADEADALDLVRHEPTYANHCRALERLRSTNDLRVEGARRVGVLSNFTIDPVVTCLRVQARLRRIPLELHVAPYNAQAREILDEASPLHRFNAETILLLLTPNAVLPAGFAEFWQTGEERRRLVREGLADLIGLLASLRAKSRATIIVANFVSSQKSLLGILDWQEPAGIERAVQELNHGLADWAQAQERVYVFDLSGLSSAFGRDRAFDQRMRLLADQPFATPFVPRVAAELARYLRAVSGPSRKCLVLDLDNTLWGGILGEDGAERLRLGGDAVGEGYLEFQRAILGLHHRGIVLALCSRNDEAEAMEVIRRHPGMILRPEHFAVIRVNYRDKVDNLESLAAELNIGLDSLVFMDDDPFERQSVRERLPEVLVVDLPPDPALYRGALLELDAFDTLSVTTEDRERGQMYQVRRVRERLQSEAGSLTDYLVGLGIEVTATPADGGTRTRLFQLVHKTNQFNLTTRRYSEMEFDAMLRAPERRLFGIRVRDRLGDHGIVGLVVLRFIDKVCEIETFLLSCRVLGRSIETGVLAYAVELARAAGSSVIRGRYLATAKNGLVRDLYQRHHFTFAGREDEAEVWEVALQTFEVPVPPWARVQNQQE